MKMRTRVGDGAMLLLGAALMVPFAVSAAQSPDRGPDHHDGRGDDRRGGPGGDDYRGRPDFHFREDDRSRFTPHYQSDVNRWQRSRGRRPNFAVGQAFPRGYAVRPVPRSYWQGAPPPSPGYQYGYYDGYVVAYDPATRIVADVLDLVANAAR